MPLVSLFFAILAVFGTGAIAVVAAIVFKLRGSLNPFKRAIALACSFMAGAVVGCGVAAVLAGLFFGNGTPHSSAAVATFLGSIFASGLIVGCLAAWIVDRFVVACLWCGEAPRRGAPLEA